MMNFTATPRTKKQAAASLEKYHVVVTFQFNFLYLKCNPQSRVKHANKVSNLVEGIWRENRAIKICIILLLLCKWTVEYVKIAILINETCLCYIVCCQQSYVLFFWYNLKIIDLKHFYFLLLCLMLLKYNRISYIL